MDAEFHVGLDLKKKKIAKPHSLPYSGTRPKVKVSRGRANSVYVAAALHATGT